MAVHVHAIGLSFAIFFLRGLLMLARSRFTNHAALRYTSYTVDTLEQLAAREPDARWIFVMGADMLEGFGAWRRPGRRPGVRWG